MLGDDGKKLSKRHGAVSIDAFRAEGYLPAALMNFLALLGWSYDDKTTVMSPAELVERFSLERVGPSPATFDYQKLDWLNGVYLRELPPDEYARALLALARASRGSTGPTSASAQTRAARPGEDRELLAVPRLRPLPVRAGRARTAPIPSICRGGGGGARRRSSRGRRRRSRRRCARSPSELGQKPREAFAPIRLAVTGSKVSPGLFESLELLGRDESLARLAAAYGR